MAELPGSVRRAVATRAVGRCEYCRSPELYSSSSFSVDHVLPRSRGGSDAVENLALACQGCNGRKYTAIEAVDPVNGRWVPLFNPRQQRWDEHFSWSVDRLKVLGQTPTGRATIERLGLNRPGLFALRRALIRVKAHPPDDSSS